MGSARRWVAGKRVARIAPAALYGAARSVGVCPEGWLVRGQVVAATEGAGCIEKRSADGLRSGFLGSFPQRACSGLGRFVIFWQIRTCCRGQHSTQREDAVLARTGQDGCGATG